VWQAGEMLPGRRQLSAQYGVALTTVERAVGALMSEGLLRAEDRRGTFVAATTDRASHSGSRRAGQSVSGPLVATVGIVANVLPYEGGEGYERQWPVQVLHGCEGRLASEPGLTMRFLNTVSSGEPDRPLTDALDQLLDESVDAVIVIGANVPSNLVARFASTRVPLVFAAYDRAEHPFPQVYVDDVAAGALAARHLLERGYPRLLYFQPLAVDWSAERLAGVEAVIGKTADPSGLRVLPVDPDDSVGLAPDQRAAAHRRAREVLGAADWAKGTGVIAPNDAMAEGFMEAAQEQGLEAGEDYGILGFDDWGRDCGLTSLRPPLRELGEEAAGMTMRLLRGESAPVRIALQHRLIARSSTAPWVSENQQEEERR
jgi:LacI family transcriptional regulator